MPQHINGRFFGSTEKVLARACYDAGQTDREIADACNTSVNNVIWWRREERLPENAAPAPEPEAPVREPVTRLRAIHAEKPRTAPAPRPAPRVDPRLIPPVEALSAHVGAVQPRGDSGLNIGTGEDGQTAYVDLTELLTTRLLIQGNSGSGKSHLLRRLLEECANVVQQIIVDPEGDFASFGETLGHLVIDAKETKRERLGVIGGKARRARGSVVLDLSDMHFEEQMDAAAAFLGGVFDAPAECWTPAIVAVDEAHLFAPAQDQGEDKEVRKASQLAMANLMCRGRKRGLAGIIATQRLAKLHKNVAAEASNFLMGRTSLDIDLKRVASLLGLPNHQIEAMRDLGRGEFIGLGPAISRRPYRLNVAAEVMTAGRASTAQAALAPLPAMTPAELAALMMAEDEPEEDRPVAPMLRVVGR